MLRALCALMVLFSHLYFRTFSLPNHRALDVLFAWGAEAVICFFVLSGCVVSLQSYKTTVSYISARALRILPIYYITLIATILAMVICSAPPELKKIIANAFFLQTLQGHLAGPLSFNMPTWSLSCEVIYYIMFILIMIRPNLDWPLFLVSIFIGISTYIFPGLTGGLGFLQYVFSFFCCWLLGVFVVRGIKRGWCISLETAAYMFAVGMCLSRVPLSPNYHDFFRLFGFCIGCGSLCSALMGSELHVSNEYSLGLYKRITITMITISALWLLSPSFFWTRMVLSLLVIISTFFSKTLVSWIGKIMTFSETFLIYIGGLSYALYIIHYPLIFTANYQLAEVNPFIRVFIVSVIAVAIAHLLEYWLQRKVKIFFRRSRIPLHLH